jgi:fructoselysine 6-kinase
MTLNGTDRVHGDYEEGVMKDIVFDDEDIRFAATHDLVHSALWGMAENTLPKIKAAGNARISFDYADRLDHPLVEKTLPYVDYGFYSWHRDRDSFIENFLKDKTDRGMKIAVATLGEKGSLAYNGKQFMQCGIVTVQNVINTVGAGDSYIAGFLAGIMRELPLLQCMELGAATASEVIQVFEPWK